MMNFGNIDMEEILAAIDKKVDRDSDYLISIRERWINCRRQAE